MKFRRRLAVIAAASVSLSLSVPAFADPAPAGPGAAAQPAPPPVGASPVEEARTRYARGIELYNDGDYRLALIEFQRSYDVAPNWRVLYNIGEVQFQLNTYAVALKSFERYLVEGGKEIPDKRRAEVEKDIEALRARTGYLTIKTNVDGADVALDDAVLGASPLAPSLLVDGGTRKVVVSKAGYKTESRSITVAGKDLVSVVIDLAPAEATGGVGTPAKPSHTDYTWVGWTATGALAVGATVTGILALKAKSDGEDLQKTKGVTRSQLDDAESKRQNFSLASDILIGATIVTAGVSLYFTIKGPSRTAGGAPPPRTIRPAVGVGSLAVVGSF